MQREERVKKLKKPRELVLVTLMHEGWLNMKNYLMIPASIF